jgi:hypothetical protein
VTHAQLARILFPDVGEIIARLPRTSQVELTAVESYERADANRVDVLNKLRYLRGPEPVARYAALEPGEIPAGLRHADKATLNARANTSASSTAATSCCAR